MKKTIAIIAVLALGFSAQAQSLEDGIKMYRYERYQSAEKILTPLAAGNALANYYLGLAQVGNENLDAAKATFAKYPDDAANIAGLARVSFEQNNPTQGMQLAQNAAAKAKKKEWQPLQYAADAITYSDGGNYQQAIDWYKKALESAGDNADLYIDMGDAHLKLPNGGGGGEAMNNYQHVTDKNPKNSLALSRQGALWYQARTYDSALNNYGRAKDADPQNPIPYRDLANAYYWVGKYDLAKQNIEQYLSLSDKTDNDMIQYADILYLSKDYLDAIKVVNDLINKGVIKPGFYGILAYSQMEMNDTVNALKNVRLYFAKQNPKKIFPSDYLNYARILMQSGMIDSANVQYNNAVAADTARDKSETYRKIAETFKTAREYGKASEWYTKLISANPKAPATDYFYWGFGFFVVRNYTDAAKAFEQMETTYPDQPSATYWRGRVGAAIDSEAKEGTAVPYFTKWLAIPDNGAFQKKPDDLKIAYQYLAYYYYNKDDTANMEPLLQKILVIDPNSEFVKRIKAAEDAKNKKPAPAAKKAPAAKPKK